ncbi:MAG TPA: HD domain-containing phosphohydrolase [Solirubrobacteraceae bacterium]|nr:HD domain-containing phosphohydrolase [Solirubrobacteraceae bacterium]
MSRTTSRHRRVSRVQAARTGNDVALAERRALASPATIGDLGEQRAGDDALRASEHLHRSIVETLDEGIMVQDLDGRVIAFNKSALRILRLSAEQLEEGSSYRPLLPLIHEDGSPFHGHEHPGMISLRTGEPQSGVIMGVVQPDGETRWISINSRALFRVGESTPYAAVGSFSDVTAHRRTLAELHAARLEDLKRLALVGEYRDDDTNRHTERVAYTAALLARKLGLNDDTSLMIRRAAPLHDVGKIGISDTILLKPGKLTGDEFDAMKAHTSIGGRILGESDFRVLQMATEIALTHHERWDGTGYPYRLRGEEIPISGRIVSVADAFDAMTHARPYKQAFPVARAVAEIERCSGTQFDPGVVAAFLTLDHEALVDTA